jgi:hypothetical protein
MRGMSAGLEVIVDRLRLDQKEYFLNLFQECYGDHIAKQTRRRFEWQYLMNPYRADIELDESLNIYTVSIDGKIVGCMGLWPIRAKFAGKAMTLFWTLDFIVIKQSINYRELRGRTLGEELLSKIMDDYQCPIVATGLSDASIRFWKRLPNWRFCQGPQEFSLRFDQHQSVEKPPNAGIELREFNSIEELTHESSFEELLETFYRSMVHGMIRTTRYLKWRYDSHPYHQYQFFAYFHSGAMVALLVTRASAEDYLGKTLSPKILWIVEFLVLPEYSSELPRLLPEWYKFISDQEIGIINVWTSDSKIADALGKCGFRATPDFIEPWVVDVPKSFLASGATPQFALQTLDQWYLSRGDCDFDAL